MASLNPPISSDPLKASPTQDNYTEFQQYVYPLASRPQSYRVRSKTSTIRVHGKAYLLNFHHVKQLLINATGGLD